MKTKFEGLIKEIVEEMIDDRINEIEDNSDDSEPETKELENEEMQKNKEDPNSSIQDTIIESVENLENSSGDEKKQDI